MSTRDSSLSWIVSDDGTNLERIKLIYAAESSRNPNFSASVIIFITKKPFDELIQSRVLDDYKATLQKREDHFLLHLERTIHHSKYDSGKRIVKGVAVFFESQPNIWVAVTHNSMDFFEKGLSRFIEGYYPAVSRIFLSTEEMRKSFDVLGKAAQGDVKINKAILYTHADKAKIDFEDRSYEYIFNYVEENNLFLDKAEFSILLPNHKSVHSFISRKGDLRYYGGDINFFFSQILPLVSKKGEEKKSFFDNREKKFGSEEVKPIVIEYEKDVFNSADDNNKLLAAISEISHSVISVYHRNPYLHASFLDFKDGSSFDIYVTNSREIRILPKYKASFSSLMKLGNKIFEGFDEGEVKNTEKKEYNLADILG